MKKLERNKNIFLGISAVLLFLALFNGMPYGYFGILRWVVFLTSAFVAYQTYVHKQESWMWIFGVIAIVFNPFTFIYLDRSIWLIIDVAVALVMLYAIFKLSFEKK